MRKMNLKPNVEIKYIYVYIHIYSLSPYINYHNLNMHVSNEKPVACHREKNEIVNPVSYRFRDYLNLWNQRVGIFNNNYY